MVLPLGSWSWLHEKVVSRSYEILPVSSAPPGLCFSACLQVPAANPCPNFLLWWLVTWELQAEINPLFPKMFLVMVYYHTNKNDYWLVVIPLNLIPAIFDLLCCRDHSSRRQPTTLRCLPSLCNHLLGLIFIFYFALNSRSSYSSNILIYICLNSSWSLPTFLSPFLTPSLPFNNLINFFKFNL